MIVLIPAYQPDERLVRLVEQVLGTRPDLHVVVVDDGSGPAYRPVVEAVRALGCTVIGHPTNRGKGFALRAGFEHVARVHPGQDVVCADCDGQHSPVDILRVADQVHAGRAGSGRTAMVLGARRFTGHVPVRSRFGNAMTRPLVGLATHLRVQDTQTGLRGYPASMLGWLQTVPGDRFEYELTVLLRAQGAGYRIEEVGIETIYLEQNASSHFRPLADSLRVLAPLLRFLLSSLGAFAVDAVALLALHAVTGQLLTSVVGARVISSTVNFLTNRRLVFAGGSDKPVGAAAAQYWSLAVALLAAGYGLLAALTHVGLPLVAAKVVTDATLFAASFQVQRRVVFARRAPRPARSTARATGTFDPGSRSAPMPTVGCDAPATSRRRAPAR
ncbi:bifunctional glycosyltransferase family 2/GtrA family protein [Cellulomonas sp. KRMCY2]|uniref:bifunctional glycosyltransferase family 2/GtrA family protein n=1 Tax=Cellulomonas sp. KRMCY2 TaxID=1304865 RepID=UPI00045EB007|nr:bifunctional glycosyltransferase family 2/GtrA family protein [Cellulomonas sp. KRMCY2]